MIATKAGRAICASMGIELVEANAENATMVGDAVASVLARNVEAIWVSPDLTISHGLDMIIRKAKLAKVPVILVSANRKDFRHVVRFGRELPRHRLSNRQDRCRRS